MERLLIKAKAGDNYAIQLLLNKYKNLLNSASRQHHLISIQEEAYEEAVISFYQAIKDFNESLGVPFAGYAKVKVYQCILYFVDICVFGKMKYLYHQKLIEKMMTRNF